MVTLQEVHNHPSVGHDVQAFSLYQAEHVLCNVVIPERSGWSSHVERNVNGVDLVKETNVVSELLLNFEF
jgi:hypothetical protein